MTIKHFALPLLMSWVSLMIIGCSPVHKEEIGQVPNDGGTGGTVAPTQGKSIKEDGPTKQPSPTATKGPRKPREITFADTTSEVGDKSTSILNFESTVGGAGPPYSNRRTTIQELIKKDGNKFIWKIITNDDIHDGGGQYAPSDRINKNHVELWTTNEFGNLITREGALPTGDDVAYDTYPETPVKVGDTWEGRTESQGQSYTDTHRLESIDTISGKEYAVIKSKSGSMPNLKQTEWIDLITKKVVKVEAMGELLNGSGAKVSCTFSSHLLDDNGQPVLN